MWHEDVIKAVEEEGFVSIKKDWKKWRNRNDLFDYVVTKSVEFILGFINQVGMQRNTHLLHCSSRDLMIVDEVLKKIKYNDYNLRVFDILST